MMQLPTLSDLWLHARPRLVLTASAKRSSRTLMLRAAMMAVRILRAASPIGRQLAGLPTRRTNSEPSVERAGGLLYFLRYGPAIAAFYALPAFRA
jgi:hypothetical protein